jgi:urease subunit gamma/beta
MRLTAWEEERLLVFAAAELARRHRDRGIPLNQPEVVALICDAMLEAARDGSAYEAVLEAGRTAVDPPDVMDGVASIIDEIRLEVLLDDGPRLVVLVDPLGGVVAGQVMRTGEIRPGNGRPDPGDGRERRRVSVRNESRRTVRVSSHYPFDRVNARLQFDRSATVGFRLDLPAGATQRWAPGEIREVTLVRYADDRTVEADAAP